MLIWSWPPGRGEQPRVRRHSTAGMPETAFVTLTFASGTTARVDAQGPDDSSCKTSPTRPEPARKSRSKLVLGLDIVAAVEMAGASMLLNDAPQNFAAAAEPAAA